MTTIFWIPVRDLGNLDPFLARNIFHFLLLLLLHHVVNHHLESGSNSYRQNNTHCTVYDVHRFDCHEHCMDKKRQWDYQFLNIIIIICLMETRLKILITLWQLLQPCSHEMLPSRCCFSQPCCSQLTGQESAPLSGHKGFLRDSVSPLVYLIITYSSSYLSM